MNTNKPEDTAPHGIISPIEEIIADFQVGKMVIMVDDECRENEGDLIVPAQYADAKAINFMARHGCGLICLAISQKRAERFGLNQMSAFNTDPHHTAFTVSIDAKHNITTGISAPDRAETIRVLLDPNSSRDDLVSPGHMFPLVAKTGGTLKRQGHTEASVDLAKLAGLDDAAVICEIMKEDGEMARLPDLKIYAQKHNLKIGSIADLAAHMLEKEMEPALSDRMTESRFANHKGYSNA